MWRPWVSLGIVAGLLLSLSGCITSGRKKVKKPELVEEYTIPPMADARYSQPIAYPKKVMALDDSKLKDAGQEPGMPPMPGRGGMATGMGGQMGGP